MGFVFTDPTELLAFLDKHTTFSVPKNINKNSMKSFLDLKRPENQLINEIRAHFEEPVLLIHNKVKHNDFEIFTNPSLSEIGAGKILDPIKVFQEINMFIRSKKEPKNMVQIGDKDLMFGKGFN